MEVASRCSSRRSRRPDDAVPRSNFQGVTDRDHGESCKRVGHVEYLLDFGLAKTMDRGERCTQAQRPGCEHEVLHSRPHGRISLALRAGNDDGWRIAHVLSQMIGRTEQPRRRRILVPRLERRLVAHPRPLPARPVEVAELPTLVLISDDHPAGWLEVATRGRLGGRLDDGEQICVCDGALGVEPTHRPGRTDGLEELHADILARPASSARAQGWVG